MSHLIAETFFNDPRIQRAKQLMLEALEDHRQKIHAITPSDPQLKESYDKLLSEYEHLRGGKLWYPLIGSGIGNGVFVELADGSIKYDMIDGIGVHWFGHSPPELVEANLEAAMSNTIMQGNLFQNSDSIELAQLLVKHSQLPHCFFSSSGAMANENALKLAFQKNAPASRILAFDRCFAGRSTTLSQVTDKPAFREGLPLTAFVDYIPFFDPQHPSESIQRSVETLKKLIKRYPKQHAAMLVEFVQGEGGFHAGETAFFLPLFEVLKSAGIAIIADEVQTFGRTTKLFAYQHFKLEKFIDIATIGKLSQVCATLFTEAYKPRPGLLSQTFTGSTSAIKAGKVILHELIHGEYFGEQGKNQNIHEHFSRNFNEIAKKHPGIIHGPYGIGSMVAFTPYQGESQAAIHFSQALFKAGVISFIAGSDPSRIRFLVPAGSIKAKDIDAVTSIVEKTLLQERGK